MALPPFDKNETEEEIKSGKSGFVNPDLGLTPSEAVLEEKDGLDQELILASLQKISADKLENLQTIDGGLTSTIQAIEKKEQPVVSGTVQSLARQTAIQTSINDSKANDPQQDDNVPEELSKSVFWRVVKAMIGYKVSSSLVKQMSQLLKKDVSSSNRWIGELLIMIQKKDNKLVA